LGTAEALPPDKLSDGQWLPNKAVGLFGGVSVGTLAFEFIGLAILALCLIVLAIPGDRRPSGRQIRDV
jgi:hypothetical protein